MADYQEPLCSYEARYRVGDLRPRVPQVVSDGRKLEFRKRALTVTLIRGLRTDSIDGLMREHNLRTRRF